MQQIRAAIFFCIDSDETSKFTLIAVKVMSATGVTTEDICIEDCTLSQTRKAQFTRKEDCDLYNI
jgi:hypothetical protein